MTRSEIEFRIDYDAYLKVFTFNIDDEIIILGADTHEAAILEAERVVDQFNEFM